MSRGEWMGSKEGATGKLKPSGKRFFLKLTSGAVRDVNAQREKWFVVRA